jgi:hypothetical protein
MAKVPLDLKEISDYSSKSAAVGAVLDSAELTRITADYADERAWANETQSRFNRLSSQLNVSVLITAIIGSLILVIGLLEPWFETEGWTSLRQLTPKALFVLGIGGLVIGGFSAARLYELNAGDLAGSWLKSWAKGKAMSSGSIVGR